MPITTHVYQTFIRATPEAVWQAITDPAWMQRYFHGTAPEPRPLQGLQRALLPTLPGDGLHATDPRTRRRAYRCCDQPPAFVPPCT